MTQEITTDNQTAPRYGHEGSAAIQLSGKSILTMWIISIAFHILLFVIMFAVPWLSDIVSAEPDLPLSNVDVKLTPNKSSFTYSDSPTFNKEKASIDSKNPEYKPKESTDFSKMHSKSQSKPDLSIIGVGASGGDFSKFGLSAGSGDGPTFFGIGTNVSGARRIVYVCDKSGSMTDTFSFLKDELKRSVSSLKRSQKFHVIFFSGSKPGFVENRPKKLVNAIEARKNELYDFLLGIEPGESTHPVHAMRRAFEVQPDLIYFLTDGEFDRQLLSELEKLNRNGKVRIFTIAYFSQDGAELLKQIAHEHRGEFKYVSDADIN